MYFKKRLRQIVYSIVHRIVFPENFSSDSLVRTLRDKGCIVGENVQFFHPETNFIDSTRPYLLEIGAFSKITFGVVILTHDFSCSVFRHVYHDILNECVGKTIVGENNFIGMCSIIMPGVHLGKNVIVGSGSVVTKSFRKLPQCKGIFRFRQIHHSLLIGVGISAGVSSNSASTTKDFISAQVKPFRPK